MSHGDRLAQDAAKLNRLADQRRVVQKQVDELEETIQRQQMRLASLHSALATLEKDYTETAATCAPAGAKRAVGTSGPAP